VDKTERAELIAALHKAATFGEGLLDLNERLLAALTTGVNRPDAEELEYLRAGLSRWREQLATLRQGPDVLLSGAIADTRASTTAPATLRCPRAESQMHRGGSARRQCHVSASAIQGGGAAQERRASVTCRIALRRASGHSTRRHTEGTGNTARIPCERSREYRRGRTRTKVDLAGSVAGQAWP
jgi:hypothetical protein